MLASPDEIIDALLRAQNNPIDDPLEVWEDPLARDAEDAMDAWKSDLWLGPDPASTFLDPKKSLDPNTYSQMITQSDADARANPELSAARGSDTTVTMRRWFSDFDNGYIPLKAMVAVDDDAYLRADAAASYKAMRRAARKDGVQLVITPGSGSAYRDYATQVRLKAQKGDLAATPGNSNHGWGMAVDMAEGREWIAQHGQKFGWTVLPGESWHFDYKPGSYTAEDVERERQRPRRRRPMRVEPQGLSTEDIIAPVNPLVAFPMAMTEVLSDYKHVRPNEDPRDPKVSFKAKMRGLRFVPKEFRALFAQAAQKNGLDPRLLAIVAKHESGFNPKAVSSAGAQGLMQIMPLHNLSNPFDPRSNVMFGARLLAGYIAQMGSLRLGLAAYNAGPNNHTAGLGYADSILGDFRNA